MASGPSRVSVALVCLNLVQYYNRSMHVFYVYSEFRMSCLPYQYAVRSVRCAAVSNLRSTHQHGVLGHPCAWADSFFGRPYKIPHKVLSSRPTPLPFSPETPCWVPLSQRFHSSVRHSRAEVSPIGAHPSPTKVHKAVSSTLSVVCAILRGGDPSLPGGGGG